VTIVRKYTIELDEEYAFRLARSLGRALNSLDKYAADYAQLVNTHTVDDLAALRTALFNVLPEETPQK